MTQALPASVIAAVSGEDETNSVDSMLDLETESDSEEEYDEEEEEGGVDGVDGASEKKESASDGRMDGRIEDGRIDDRPARESNDGLSALSEDFDNLRPPSPGEHCET